MTCFRIKAFVTHLFVSCTVAAISAATVFLFWHPSPLAKAVGVTHIFLLMLAIDAILGPLLTLLVAKEGKKSLKFDLSIIVLVQLTALFYGLYSIALNRPVYLAFDRIRFELVQAGDVPKESLKRAAAPYRKLGWSYPQWVAVRPAENDEENNRRTFVELQQGVAPSMQPDLYVSLETQWPQILKKSKPLAMLMEMNSPLAVQAILEKYPQADCWLPLKAYEVDMVVLLNSRERKIIKIVDLRAWK